MLSEHKIKRTESFASIFGDESDTSFYEMNEKKSILKLEQLIPFEHHPFKLYQGERLDDMVESIKNFGIIVPIVVRKKDDKFQILSGHNRANSARLAGLDEVPAIIKEGLTEEEATLIVTETNLMQRSFTDLLHSERATVIATRHKAMKQQGVRSDLLEEIEKLSKVPKKLIDETCAPVGHKLKTRDIVGAEYNLSKNSVARYLRIHELSDSLKDMVDEAKIAIRAGVDLSYMTPENQEMIEAIISENTFKVDMKKASMLRQYDQEGKLNWETAKSIISGEALKGPEKPKAFKVQPAIISRYFKPTQKGKDIEAIIEKALEMYFRKQENIEESVEEGEEEIG